MQVLKFMSHCSSEEYIRKHGVNSIKAMEEEIVKDAKLLKSFEFSCSEAGIQDEVSKSSLPKVHQLLVRKMVHTYSYELLKNRQMILNRQGGIVLDIPMMLREILKVKAAGDSK